MNCLTEIIYCVCYKGYLSLVKSQHLVFEVDYTQSVLFCLQEVVSLSFVFSKDIVLIDGQRGIAYFSLNFKVSTRSKRHAEYQWQNYTYFAWVEKN